MEDKESNRFLCDEDFFNRETEHAFYWAGFIMADGCMHEPRKYGDGGVRGKKLTIDLGIIDVDHLEKFKTDLRFKGNILIHTIHGTEREAAKIAIRSDKLYDSLIRFGIVPRKSKECRIPDWVLEHKYAHHFLRGLFDGDGCIFLDRRQAHPQMAFSIVGTEDIARQYMDAISDITGFPKKLIKASGSFTFWYKGNSVCEKIRDFIYRDSTVFLNRKREKFFEVSSRGNGRKLIMHDPEHEETFVFNGIKEASYIGGFCRTGISQCLNGEREMHRGCYFQELEEVIDGDGQT